MHTEAQPSGFERDAQRALCRPSGVQLMMRLRQEAVEVEVLIEVEVRSGPCHHPAAFDLGGRVGGIYSTYSVLVIYINIWELGIE